MLSLILFSVVFGFSLSISSSFLYWLTFDLSFFAITHTSKRFGFFLFYLCIGYILVQLFVSFPYFLGFSVCSFWVMPYFFFSCFSLAVFFFFVSVCDVAVICKPPFVLVIHWWCLRQNKKRSHGETIA
jgi:hypothetical protein